MPELKTLLGSFTELNFSCKRGFLLTTKAASCAGQKSLQESLLHPEPLLLCKDCFFDRSKEFLSTMKPGRAESETTYCKSCSTEPHIFSSLLVFLLFVFFLLFSFLAQATSLPSLGFGVRTVKSESLAVSEMSFCMRFGVP